MWTPRRSTGRSCRLPFPPQVERFFHRRELLAEILTPWSERFQLETIVIGGQGANDFELFQEPLKHLPVRKPIRKHAALYGAAKQFLEEKAK